MSLEDFEATSSKFLSLSVTSVPAPPFPVWLCKRCLNLVLHFCCGAFIKNTSTAMPFWLPTQLWKCFLKPKMIHLIWHGPHTCGHTRATWYLSDEGPPLLLLLQGQCCSDLGPPGGQMISFRYRLHSGKSALRTNYLSFALSICHSNSVHKQWLTCLGMPWNHCWLSLSPLFLLLIYSLFRKHRHLTEVPLGLLAGF